MRRVVPAAGIYPSGIPTAPAGSMQVFEVSGEAAAGETDAASAAAASSMTTGGDGPLPTVEEGAARLLRSPVKLLVIGEPDGSQTVFLFKVREEGSGRCSC